MKLGVDLRSVRTVGRAPMLRRPHDEQGARRRRRRSSQHRSRSGAHHIFSPAMSGAIARGSRAVLRIIAAPSRIDRRWSHRERRAENDARRRRDLRPHPRRHTARRVVPLMGTPRETYSVLRFGHGARGSRAPREGGCVRPALRAAGAAARAYHPLGLPAAGQAQPAAATTACSARRSAVLAQAAYDAECDFVIEPASTAPTAAALRQAEWIEVEHARCGCSRASRS